MNQRKAGVILSYIKMFLSGAVNLIYVPLLLFFLSKEEYGLYQLVGSVIAYLTLMDFGLADTVTRYYANYMARNDSDGLCRLLSTVSAVYGFIAAMVILVGIVLLQLCLPLYTHTLSAQELHTAQLVYWILLINVALAIPSNIFKAVINAHQRFVFAQLLIIINTVLQPVLVCAVLMAHPSVVALAIVQTVCNIAMIACNVYYCRRHLQVSLQWCGADRKILKETLLFSTLWFTVALVDQIFWRSGQLVLGAVVGTAAVAVYSVTIQLQVLYGWFSVIISKVFLPRLSAIAATGEQEEEMNAIFLKTSRLQTLISALLVSGFIMVGKEFIFLWLGDGFSQAYIYGVVLMVCFFIPSVQNTGLVILQARNKLGFYAGFYVVLAFVSLLVSIGLAKQYGGLGCAWGTGGALFVGGLVMNRYYANMGLGMRVFWKDIAQVLVVTLLAMAIFYMIKKLWPLAGGWMSFIGQGGLYSVLWGGLMWGIVLNKYEKNLALEMGGQLLRFARLRKREHPSI